MELASREQGWLKIEEKRGESVSGNMVLRQPKAGLLPRFQASTPTVLYSRTLPRLETVAGNLPIPPTSRILPLEVCMMQVSTSTGTPAKDFQMQDEQPFFFLHIV